MNKFLIIITIILFIIAFYLFLKRNDLTLIQKSKLLVINFIGTIFLLGSYFYVYWPLPGHINTNVRIQFMQNFIDNKTHEWGKGNIHSEVPFLIIDTTLDSLTLIEGSPYHGQSKESFNIMCFDISYDAKTANTFVDSLISHNKFSSIDKLVEFFKGNVTDPLNVKSTFLKDKLIGRINKSYGIAHNDTLLNDKFFLNQKWYYTKWDFGNLCPPECDGFLRDSLILFYEEADLPENKTILKEDSPKWKEYRAKYNLKN